MSTITSKIAMGGGKTLVSLFSIVIAAGAILPARGDGLAITPATLPVATQQVDYAQTLVATNISGTINYDNWKLVSWNMETAPNSYAVGANETPLWEGAQSFRTNILFKLPIAFPYRGKIYDSIQLNTGGQFYLREGNYYTPFDRSPSYSSLKYCDIGISPLWLTRNQLVEGWVDSSVDGEVSFRFAGTYTYNDDACSFAYRVTLKRDGTIRFAYRQGDDLGGAARVIGISAYGNNYESLRAAEDETGIPAVDYVFSTYGLPDGFSLSTKDYNYSLGGYYNYQIYGKTDTPCQSKFAISVKDGEGNCVTNIYDFIVVENPDRPPVIDAFTPADTNVVRMLTIGQTLDFHIDASDPVGGTFDVKWKFAAADSSYDIQSGIELGSGPDLTFVATKELYEAQSRYGSSILICTVSDEFWSKSVSWRVYIRRDTYIDPAADPTEADGSAAHPLATFAPSAIKKGDTVILAPGTYNVNSWSDTPAVTIRSSGNRDNTRIVVSTSTPIRGSSSSERAVIRNVTIEGSSGIVNANLYDCTVTGADSNGSLFNQANLSGCYVHGNIAANSLFSYSSIVDCTVAGNTIDVYDSEDTYHYYYALGYNCTLERSIVVNNLTLDGVEHNWWPDSGNVSSAENCCSIPAMTDFGEGNIEAQPLFVCMEEGDLRLRAGSPCLAVDPADNIGAYKEAGVEGFVVHAVCDPVRGIVEPSFQIVAAGGNAVVRTQGSVARDFLGWTTNGVAIAGSASILELTLENISGDIEIEALYEVRDINVSPVGDDGNDGRAGNPVVTIAKAAELALEGETIILAEGSYAPAILSETFATDNRRLTFVGAGAGRTFIDGGGTNRCLQLGPNMTLKGASIINGYQSNGRCASGVTGGTIENCIVSNCVARANTTAAGAYDTTIISSLVANNTNTASSAYYAGGCYSCCIYNSTIANNSISGYGTGGAVECVLVNNVIWGNTNEDSSYYDNENFYRAWNNPRHGSILTGDSVRNANMVGGNDWFADAAVGDYRLVGGSPAIDAGANIDEISYDGATDLAGNPRIKNGVVDYGAYEGGVATAAPAAPEATATNAKASKGIPLSWASVRNAVEYRIYRATSADGTQTLVGTTTDTSFKDMTVDGDTDYFYWVAGYADETFGEGAKFGPIAVRALPDLRIETTSLPAATEATPYSVQLACYGNMGDVTWSLPYTVVTRAASTFDGSLGVKADENWPTASGGEYVVSLPFPFTWFGTSYDKITVTEFGGFLFGEIDDWLITWGAYAIDDYPKIAVLEGRERMVKATDIRFDVQSDHVTIVWRGNYTNWSDPAEFSATLYPDGTVHLAYGSNGNKHGGYIALSNGSADTVRVIKNNSTDNIAGMDDIVIACLPNESGLVISEDGLLSGIIDDAGTYQVSALVEDSANGDVAYKTFTLTVNANANTRPVIDATTPDEGSMVIPQGDSQTFAVTAHDPESAALSYKWYLDDELVSSGASYTFTASSIGYHTLVCDVADALWTNGQVYAEWEIHVGSKIYVDAASTAAEPDGTQAAPYKTIMSALNSAGNGDTILVAPGTYGQTYLSGGWYSGGPTIVVRSTGSAADTFIDGNGERPCVANYCYHDGLTFVGFTLRNGHADYDWTPTRGGGGSFMVNLKNCAVYNCTAEGAGGGVFGAMIDHCTIFGCSAGTGGGIDATSSAFNSIVWGNTATNAGASATANYEAATNGVQFTASCTSPLPASGTGNIADDPMLADAASGDWRLLVGSPCLSPRMGCYDGDGITEGDIGTSYTVTFDANGGECATATRKVGEGQPIGALPSATRAGYTFDGWYTAKTEGFKVSESYEVTKDQTLYARWTETVYFTVTFDANGGTCEEASRSVQSGTAIGALPSATRAGYTLSGWYTEKSGGTQVTASTKVTKAQTIYARWTEIPTYTVTFDANGGTCDETSRKVEQRTAVGELPEATWTSHSFDGWFAAKDGGSQFFATNAVTANITLYAHWTEIYELTIEDGVLTGFTGALPKTLAIPTSVTAFGADLFKGEKNLTTITGGRNVTKCGAGAFRDTGLWDAAPDGPVVVCGVLVGYKGTVPETLILAEGVKVIADGALAGVSTLKTVYLPSSIAVIGAGAFAGSANLDDVYGLENATDVAADAFEGTLHVVFRLTVVQTEGRKTVIGFKGPCPAEITIPEDVLAIGGGAFMDQTVLTNVTAAGPVEIIGTNAFSGCTGLVSVEMPPTLAFISKRAFRDCAALRSFNVPSGVVTIDEAAFQSCTALSALTGGEGVEVIRTDAFAGTPWYDAAPAGAFEEVMLGHVLVRMKGEVPASYEISTNVWMVANNAFAGVTTLTDLYIGTEVLSLWDRAFAGCTSLTSVTVPSGCREFGDYLFDGCTSLTNVYFRGHAPTNDVPHVFSGTPATLTVRVKEGSRGWIEPGSDSDLVPARWPYKTGGSQLVATELNRAVYEPEEIPGVVRSVIVDGTITNDTTWIGGKVYEVQSGYTVEAGATLTIEAGAIVKLPLDKNRFYGTAGLQVHGKLVANGTLANPVVFTSIRDDSWGGDTNGDGDRSEPYPGECAGVDVGCSGGPGGIEARYAKFLYGNAGNVYGAGACLMLSTSDLSSSLYGCEFAHAAKDGCFAAGAKFENCVFRDCDRGLLSISVSGSGPVAVNCVAYGNRVGFFSHTGDMYLTNCIAAFNSEWGISSDGTQVYSTRCCLWNPDGQNNKFDQYADLNKWWTRGLVVENIAADPLFLDAENGDFRISVESPCVDAAYGDVAPELDFYGKPRMDVSFVRNTGRANAEGVFPDIGLYEVPGTTERPVMNLEVESVSFAATTVAPGETLTVNYTVRNTGAVAAKGSIRDTVRIKSAANGGTMTAGTVTQNYNLEPGASVALVASVAMPAAPEGEWLVGIDVNPNRDVFEQNFLKNSLWTEDAVEVRLLTVSCGDGTLAVTVPAETTMGWTIANLSAEGGVVVINGAPGGRPLPVVARVATGHMPTAAMNDAVSFVRSDGAIAVVIPPHAAGDAVYLAIENTGVSAELINVTVQPLATELWSVYPEEAANVGEMGFTFTGAGLTAESEFYLGSIRAKSVSVIDSANVYAVFNVQGISADRYYDVTADGKTIRDAVRINKVAKGPILEAKLELPERTRDNRVYTGYVVYENTGDTQMNAPTFIVDIAEASSTNTVIGAYDDDDDNLTQQRVLIIGLGSSHPAGVLKPGDSGRLPFKFRPVGSYQFKLDSRYTSDEVASAATRMNLRGGPVRFDGYSARGLANLVKKGETAAAVSGHLLDVRTREPLGKAALKLAHADDASFVRVVTTDDDGYFSFEQLKDGSYALVADTGYTLVTTNRIEVAGQADINGYEATALPPGTVSGYVMGEDGTVIQYGEVTLFKSANDMEGTTIRTDGYGAYRFAGLEDGEYAVFARPYGSFKGLLATNAVVSAAARDLRADFALPKSVRAYGTVTGWKGGTADGGEVRFYQEDGEYFKAEVSTNGTWDAQGLAPGKYSVSYISADGMYDSASAEVTLAVGDETEIPLAAIPATPFKASTSFGVIDAGHPTLTVYFAATGYANDTNVASVVWNFGDGSGTYETNAVATAHTYTEPGLYTVSVQPRYENGTLGAAFALEDFLQITNQLETIYKDNAIVLGGYAPEDAGFTKDAGTLVVTGVGEDFVTLSGAPGAVPLAAGSVIAGTYKDANNEDDWFLRRIVGVTGDETAGWTLATEHGNEEDLYEQYWSYWSEGVEEAEPPAPAPSPSFAPAGGGRRARLASIGDSAMNLLKKASGSVEKGIEFEVECSPDLQYHYSCRITSNVWRTVKRTMYGEQWEFQENIGPKRRELRIWGDVSLKADITANASFTGGWSDDKTYELVPKAYRTIPSAAKAVPYFKIGYNASGTLAGSAHASAEVKGYMDVGFVKESGKDIQWYKPKPFDGNVDISFDAEEDLDVSVSFEASVSAGFGVKVKAFEVVTAAADVMFNAKASVECSKNAPSRASVSIGYDTNVEMNFIDLTWLNKNWKAGMDWSIEGPTLWSMEWISAWPKFTYRQPHSKEWPARITVTDRSERGTFADARGRTYPIPIERVDWDYGQGQSFSYGRAQIDSGEYKKHRVIEFPGDQEEGEYIVSLNVQGGVVPNLWPCQKKIKIKKPDEPEEQSKIQKEEWFSDPQDTQQSVDPNEMAGPAGVGEQRYVKPGQEMTYTIYFENKADAAIAAQEVFVDNALSEYLDWSTFRMGTISVGGQIIRGLDGYTADEIALATNAGLPPADEIDQTNGLYKTRAEVQFDAATGIVSWYIRVVDAAKRAAGDGECWPDDDTAGVLQPNVVSPEGEGYIIFTVNVSSNAPANVIIDNSANIVFDKNPAIVTDPAWWNTIAKVARVQVEGELTDLELIVGLPYGEALPPAPAAQPGYTFGGWYTGPNGTGRRVRAQDNVEAGDSGLYAHWLANAYKVHFEPNGGTGLMSDQAFEFDKPAALDANAFKRKFYAFAGWATNETGVAVYADGEEVENLTSVSNGVVTLYATWSYHAIEVAFDAQGGTPAPTNCLYELDAPYGEFPEVERSGFTFGGWYTGPNGTGRRVTVQAPAQADATKLYAHWLVQAYTVRFNANGGIGEMSDQAFEFDKPAALDANAFTRMYFEFAGWATSATGVAVYADGAVVENLTSVDGGVVTLYATWTLIPQPEPTVGPTVDPTPAPVAAETPRLWTEVTGTVPTVAALYEGYFCDGTGNVKGTIQVKVGKPGKKDGRAAVSAVVVGLDGKKTKLKAAENGKAMLAADGPTTVSLAGGEACEVVLGAKGMSGTYGSYAIDGSLNVFASKDAADKSVAAATLDKWKGVVNVAWKGEKAWNGLSVNIAAKGKAKVSGTLADGTKVSASGQLIVGENWCCVPVVYAKKGVSLQFNVWLPKTATSAAAPVVVGLGEDVKVGKPGTLKGGAAFRIDSAALEAVLGKAVLPYLPDGLPVTGGAKWTLPKAGSVTYAKGTTTVDAAKAGENPSGLKLTYKAKDGTFKGSFKAYSDVGGKPKATTVNVTGVLVDGVGYGAATVKKVGGVSVKVE